jgi:uncharacterized protein (DUF2384 family)
MVSPQEGLDCRVHLPRDDVAAVPRIVGHVLGQVSRICRGENFSYDALDRRVRERMSEEGSEEARRAECVEVSRTWWPVVDVFHGHVSANHLGVVAARQTYSALLFRSG